MTTGKGNDDIVEWMDSLHVFPFCRSAMRLFPTVFLIVLLATFIFFAGTAMTQTIADSKSLPRAALDERFPSAAAESFLREMQEKKMDLHSVMILKNGKVVYERWFGENAPGKNHVMWSVSKTWTAMAVGFAIAEGKFTVEDKVISFFPNDLPAEVPENLAELRVKDLLTMSVGHEKDPTGPIRGIAPSWEKFFFAYPIPHKPGTKFVYNSVATYMLSSLVRKTTGENLIDYLKPRLFEPLGIEGAKWDSTSEGINIGGWGLHVKTEDMAKLGQLLLQKGKWDGRQLLPESWIEEATTSKILQNPNVDLATSTSDWQQGYCYQIWRCRHNAFRADGKDGQFIVVLPEQNAVVVLTANIGDMQAELNLVWEHLFPALK
jgi:CubicO group peptidase (beta-lactamase class C family)